MKLTYSKILFIFAIFSICVFSSCVDEDVFEWYEATLNAGQTIPVRSDGTFSDDIFMDRRYVKILDGGRFEIDQLRFVEGAIVIHTRDLIGDITFRVPQLGLNFRIDNIRNDKSIYNDRGTQYFLEKLVKGVNQYGEITIEVDGGYTYSREVDIDFELDIDAYANRY